MASQINIGGKSYTRLPGRARRLFGMFSSETQRLYIGEDHLFVATTSYYYERYKRFYLADIQSLTIQKSAAGMVLNIVLGTIAGLFATIAAAGYLSQWTPAAQITMVVIAGIFLGIALINTAFGPTCQCHILTAVHEEPLYSLGRLYTAQRIVEYLRAMIEGVQGAAGDMTDATAAASQRVERAVDRRDAAMMIRKDSGRLHVALFAVLIFDAILGTIHIFVRDGWPTALSLASNIAIVLLVFAAAIRQRDSDVPRSVRTTVWVALVFNMGMMATSMYVAVFLQAIQQTPEASVTESVQSAFLTYGNAVNLFINLPTALVGLYNVQIWRKAAAAQAEQRRVVAEEGTQP